MLTESPFAPTRTCELGVPAGVLVTTSITPTPRCGAVAARVSVLGIVAIATALVVALARRPPFSAPMTLFGRLFARLAVVVTVDAATRTLLSPLSAFAALPLTITIPVPGAATLTVAVGVAVTVVSTAGTRRNNGVASVVVAGLQYLARVLIGVLEGLAHQLARALAL